MASYNIKQGCKYTFQRVLIGKMVKTLWNSTQEVYVKQVGKEIMKKVQKKKQHQVNPKKSVERHRVAGITIKY